jgi:hypothetical protein
VASPFKLLTSGIEGVRNLTAAWDNNLGWVLNWSPVLNATGYRIYRESAQEKNEQPDNPFVAVRLTEYPLIATTFVDRFEPQELQQYSYKVVALDVNGNESVSTAITVNTPKLAAQNNLLLYSEDFSSASWVKDAGVVVTNAGAGNGWTINFGGANKAISQIIPTFPLAGRVYTFGVYVKGTAGQTLSLFAHGEPYAPANGYTMPTNFTLTGGWDWVVVTRPAINTNDRFLRLGVQTYNGATATSIQMKYARVAAGAATTVDAFAAAYETTLGLGTTWQEPIKFATAPTGPYNGWHQNLEMPGIAAIEPTGTIVFDGSRTRSVAHHFWTTNGGVNLTVRNHRAYGLAPKAQGAMRGHFIAIDFLTNLVVENNYAYRTAGTSFQLFWGVNTPGSTFKFRYNFFRELDGRYYNLDGTTVQSSWASLHSDIWPNSIGAGRGIANMVGLHKIEKNNAGNGITNPFGYGIDGAEISYNVLLGRTGFTTHEDVWNLSEMRGTVTSPIKIHHNFTMSSPQIDLEWVARGYVGAYNQGRVLSPYPITITTTADAASGATVVPIQPSPGPIPPETPITLNGVTFLNKYEVKKGSTQITLKDGTTLTGAIPNGSQWNATLKWGPQIVSSSAGLTADGVRGDRWEQNNQYIEMYANVAIGEELIFADVGAGADRNTYNNEVWAPDTLFDGKTQIVNRSRNYGYQLTNYADPKTMTVVDQFGVQQKIFQRIAMFANQYYGSGGGGDPTTDADPPAKTYGAQKFPAPSIQDCWNRLGRYKAELALVGIVIGVIGAAAGGLTGSNGSSGAGTTTTAAPSNPNLQNTADAMIVSWTPVVNAKYLIKRSDGTGRQYLQIAPLLSTATYTDPTVYDSQTVTYRVYSVINGAQAQILEVSGTQTPRIWNGPITATNNQVITGNYRSLTVGNAINMSVNSGATVTNSIGWGLHPGSQANANDRHNGKMVNAGQSASLVFENNYVSNWWFMVYADGQSGTNLQRIKVRFNRSRNIQGRVSNNNGGYDLLRYSAYGVAHAVQINNAYNMVDAEIAWNETIQEEGIGFVEDIINIYTASGSDANHPWRVHNNLVRGGYAINPPSSNQDGSVLNNGAYSGCGVISDGLCPTDITKFSYGQIYRNVVTGVANSGIGIAGGNYVEVWRNRMASSGLTPSGAVQYAINSGLYIWAQYGGTFSNINVHDNEVAWVNKDGSKNKAAGTGDFNNTTFLPSLSSANNVVHSNTTNLDGGNGYIAWAQEEKEHLMWWQRVVDRGVHVGPYAATAKKGRVSFINESGYLSAQTTIRAVFESKGLKYTETVITDNIGNGTNLAASDIQSMIAAGHGVITRGKTTDKFTDLLGSGGEAAVRANITASKAALEAITGKPVNAISYPSGTNSAATDAIVKDYYDTAFIQGGLTNQSRLGGDYSAKFPQMNITRSGFGEFFDPTTIINGVTYYGPTTQYGATFDNVAGTSNTSSLEYYKAKVKQAYDNDWWLVFRTYGQDAPYASGQTQATFLGQLLDYINTLNINTTPIQ